MLSDEIHHLPPREPGGRKPRVGWRIDSETGCWLWTGFSLRGYARTKRGQAAREVWEHVRGLTLGPEWDLHHKCDAKLCVNPDHMEPILSIRHRGSPGALSADQIEELWMLIDLHWSLDEIARELGRKRNLLAKGETGDDL